jgi:choline kinase
MKVMMDRGRLTEVGKTLPVDTVNGEAIGFYMFRGDGVKAYRDELELAMRDPQGSEALVPFRRRLTCQEDCHLDDRVSPACAGLRWISPPILPMPASWWQVGIRPKISSVCG